MATSSFKVKALNLFPYSDDGIHGYLGGNAIYNELIDGVESGKDVVCPVSDGDNVIGQWTDPTGVHHTIIDPVDWMLSDEFFAECKAGDLGKDSKGFRYTKVERVLETDTGLTIRVRGVYMPDKDDVKLLGSVRTNVHRRWRYAK